MYVARVLYPVEVLGPGKRIGIWFSGCPRKCKGCSNPELWEFNDKYETTPNAVYALIKSVSDDNQVDGFTITGGDPMYQADDLIKLIDKLKNISEDILVYTGYKIEDLHAEQLKNIAVLIDGEYIEKRNNNCFLRGSDNQRIHILNSKFKQKYKNYIESGTNKIQNFMTNDGVISVGIHKPNFIDDLNKTIVRKGLKNSE